MSTLQRWSVCVMSRVATSPIVMATFNPRTPAAKRIMREMRELRDPTPQFAAAPLEDNIFEWHFTVAGPPDTDFAGGRYHGRITLPPDYPFKPPTFMILTPNGRFEVGKKICLSVSAHHPESWQPAWGIRTVLIALIGFFPTPGNGAVAALDYTPEERRKLARRSRTWTCPTCGVCMNDALPDGDVALSQADIESTRQFTFVKGRSPTTSESAPDTTPAAPDNTVSRQTSAPASDTLSSTEVARQQSIPAASAPSVRQRRSTTTQPSATLDGMAQITQATAADSDAWKFNVVILGILLAIAFLVLRKWTREAQ
eukprot:m.411431 g.411431  ORF g.411431 m.411431 type:complete len:313 (+) comp20164_c1_seq13:1256-2194(+)